MFECPAQTMDIHPVRLAIEQCIQKVLRCNPTVTVLREDISKLLSGYSDATKEQLLRDYLLLSDGPEIYIPPAEYPRGAISGTPFLLHICRDRPMRVKFLIIKSIVIGHEKVSNDNYVIFDYPGLDAEQAQQQEKELSEVEEQHESEKKRHDKEDEQWGQPEQETKMGVDNGQHTRNDMDEGESKRKEEEQRQEEADRIEAKRAEKEKKQKKMKAVEKKKEKVRKEQERKAVEKQRKQQEQSKAAEEADRKEKEENRKSAGLQIGSIGKIVTSRKVGFAEYNYNSSHSLITGIDPFTRADSRATADIEGVPPSSLAPVVSQGSRVIPDSQGQCVSLAIIPDSQAPAAAKQTPATAKRKNIKVIS